MSRSTPTPPTSSARASSRLSVAARLCRYLELGRTFQWDIAFEGRIAALRWQNPRGATRADFRYDDTPGGTGEIVCLEVNTQPGMTGTSLVPELAQHQGMSFPELVTWIIEDATIDR